MRYAVVTVATLVVVAGCTSGPATTTAPPTPAVTTSAPAGTTPAPSSRPRGWPASSSTPRRSPPSRSQPVQGNDAVRALDAMSETQRVGQLFMVGSASSGAGSDAVTAITAHHVGSVIVTDTSRRSATQIAALSQHLQALAGGIGLFVATDQEGGQVQRLRGPGFDAMPSGVEQGGMAPDTLRADAARWGRQLRAAGINLDLAPVVDTVPSAAFAGDNPPVGSLQREYGYDPATVTSHGIAFVRGLADAGVDATLKHFPGLGRVTGNTDTASGVTDSTTTRHDAYLAPFAAAIKAGAPLVMVSTAYYARIDPDRPAAFSPTIVTGMLRGDLGFRGVVISDDLGGARQVASFSPGTRAVDFIAAGGDVVLTVDAGLIPAMTAAVLAKARSDPAFRAKVDAAALRVLRAKQARGLLAD